MITLITHSTKSWLPRIRPYLESLNQHSPFENVLLTLDFDAHAEFMDAFPKVKAVRVPKTAGSPEYSDSLQHGSFLPYVDGDLLIYTDGDIVMQRIPVGLDLIALSDIKEGEVMCGWNSGPDETLAIEATRLFPRHDPASVFGEMVKTTPCYNIGVIAARRETWQAIHDTYMKAYDQALATFAGPQRQQWLVCWAFAVLGLKVKVMPYSMHVHGCYALPVGASLNGTLNYEGSPVLFRHHV